MAEEVILAVRKGEMSKSWDRSRSVTFVQSSFSDMVCKENLFMLMEDWELETYFSQLCKYFKVTYRAYFFFIISLSIYWISNTKYIGVSLHRAPFKLDPLPRASPSRVPLK